MKGPFRIDKSSEIKAQSAEAGDAFKDYMGRLITLIPAEVIAVYLTVRGFFILPHTQVDNTASGFIGIWPAICLLLVFMVRVWGTRDDKGSRKSIQWWGVIISSVSFVIWILAIGDGFFGLKPGDLRIASTLVVLWTFVVGYFYKGE